MDFWFKYSDFNENLRETKFPSRHRLINISSTNFRFVIKTQQKQNLNARGSEVFSSETLISHSPWSCFSSKWRQRHQRKSDYICWFDSHSKRFWSMNNSMTEHSDKHQFPSLTLSVGKSGSGNPKQVKCNSLIYKRSNRDIKQTRPIILLEPWLGPTRKRAPLSSS